MSIQAGFPAEGTHQKIHSAIEIHPDLLALYRRKAEDLQAALNDPELRGAAGDVLRSLITRITLTPAGDRLDVQLYGELAELVAFGKDNNDPASGEVGPLLSLVAGAGFEPATFRL